ncbi:hypothetical protein L1987_59473 [Smallanthus sonchifolius]|uniref:Uncharacterized protein n=1 Tax=Smallanthus sonchifolius TaxID=185202 RepID=A0ACB9D5K8_9ASTR|nr:hypothetical protein L1987_59473 [Smallanthus sonchifolius]
MEFQTIICLERVSWFLLIRFSTSITQYHENIGVRNSGYPKVIFKQSQCTVTAKIAEPGNGVQASDHVHLTTQSVYTQSETWCVCSPPGHNTPTSMSGPLALLPFESESATCNWISREEEEEDVSKRYISLELYQREEAKVQAWVNLQKAKAEAQSRKLEVRPQTIGQANRVGVISHVFAFAILDYNDKAIKRFNVRNIAEQYAVFHVVYF